MKLVGFLASIVASIAIGWQVTQFLGRIPGYSLGTASEVGGLLAWCLVFAAAVVIFGR